MQQRKILLLENVATQAAGVREHLAQAGFEVMVSRYEADGLKRLVEWGPDLVLVSTAHPAGDFAEYCRRVRTLAPAVRIVVTSSLNRDRLFQQYPGLQAIVDGVLLRPYSREEVVALLATGLANVPAAAPAVAAAPVPAPETADGPGVAELRAEFQRQLDARFLEVEELKRRLEVATRRVASTPGLEWLQSENDHLRQGVDEERKKSALALASEQLKRSEIEVKLDNLLRMKEDFEFRAQNEIGDRTLEVEQLRSQLQDLRESSEKAAGEHAAQRTELERALVEKEQVEERLHALEAGGLQEAASAELPRADETRLAALEAELSLQRAIAAEGQVALADMAAKTAVLEESLTREQSLGEEQSRSLSRLQARLDAAGSAADEARSALAVATEGRTALEQELAAERGELAIANEARAALEKELAAAQAARTETECVVSDLRDRLAAVEASAIEARSALTVATEGRAALEKELAAVQEARVATEGVVTGLRDRLAAAESFADEARGELATAKESRAVLEKELAAVQAVRIETEGVVTGLRGRLASAEASAFEARSALGAATEGRATLERELAAVQEARVATEGVVTGLQERLAAAESFADEARSELATANESRAALEKELADVQVSGADSVVSGLQGRVVAAETAALAARNECAAANGRSAGLEKELADLQQACAREARLVQERQGESAARIEELLERAVTAERGNENLRSASAGLEERLAASEEARISAAAAAEKAVRDLGRLDRELTGSRDRVRQLEAECERAAGLLAERERAQTGELRAWRESAESAALEIQMLQSQAAERASREAADRLAIGERQQQADREVQDRDRQNAALREELAAAGEARRQAVRESEVRALEAEAAAREARGRLEKVEAALVAAREDHAIREREARLQIELQQTAVRELEERLAARVVPEDTGRPVQPELQRIQELLEEVISRARNEAVDHARRDAELSTRLQAALEERRLLQERFDRAGAEASERERRSSSLLQSDIDHGPSPIAERANLPAVVPPDPGTAAPRRMTLLAGIAAALLAVVLAVFGLRRATVPPADREPSPLSRPQAVVSAGAARTPREVWERWTRSDGSGGVLVQATLRSELELRAEVEADRARGAGDEDVRAELARRLSAFRFNTTHYVTVYLKNLSPGYPAYLDDLPGRFRLRDSKGNEVPAFLPPGHEKDRRVFSFGSGAPGELIYEASVSLGFDRAGLAPSSGYLQLVVSDIGAASRRVLTWELE